MKSLGRQYRGAEFMEARALGLVNEYRLHFGASGLVSQQQSVNGIH